MARGLPSDVPVDATGEWTVARALRELPPDALWEIDEGRLEMRAPPGPYHADAAGQVYSVLRAFVLERGLGRVLVGDPGFHLAHRPDILCAPDVAFIGHATMQQIRDPDAFAEVRRIWRWRCSRRSTGPRPCAARSDSTWRSVCGRCGWSFRGLGGWSAMRPGDRFGCSGRRRTTSRTPRFRGSAAG